MYSYTNSKQQTASSKQQTVLGKQTIVILEQSGYKSNQRKRDDSKLTMNCGGQLKMISSRTPHRN